MGESLKVRNTGRGQISFMIYPPIEYPEGLPKHKRRKMLRESVCSIMIPSTQTCDLVEATGLSVKVLESLPEVQSILKKVNAQRVDLVEVERVPASAPMPAPAPAPMPETPQPVVADSEPPPAPEAEPIRIKYSERTLSGMTKSRLQSLATGMCGDLDSTMKKSDFVEAILKAQGDSEE